MSARPSLRVQPLREVALGEWESVCAEQEFAEALRTLLRIAERIDRAARQERSAPAGNRSA